MDSFSIGISGLGAAQKGLDIVGNNIANAATPGYHRQRINLNPSRLVEMGDTLIGGGVDFAGTTRIVDSFLEGEITRQQSTLGEIDQQLQTLRTLETAFGELSAGEGLSEAIDEFYNSVEELSRYPNDSIWQNNALSSAKAMTGKFRNLSASISDLKQQSALEANGTIDQINTLAGQIAELNSEIQSAAVQDTTLNNTMDQRDQRIKELAELIGIDTIERPYGVIDVAVSGIPLVSGTSATELSAGLNDQGKLGLAVEGEVDFRRLATGGTLGGLMKLHNEHLTTAQSDLDKLANTIAGSLNELHTMGVGSSGSFTNLTGDTTRKEQLSQMQPPISDGTIYIRVTDTETGQITRQEVPIDAANDTLSDVADYITNNIDGINANIVSSQLKIQAESGYEFDFMPAVLPEPTSVSFSGDVEQPEISLSGVYSEMANKTYTFEVSGSGSVGNGELKLQVTDSNNENVTELDIGSGYAAGTKLDVGNGIKIALTPGEFEAGDSFEVAATGITDTSGLLTAAGINTFFTGSKASDLYVHDDIIDAPDRIATSIGPGKTDNENVLRMAALKDRNFEELNRLSPREFYRRMVTEIGQEIESQSMRRDNTEAVIKNLDNQIQEISGVDINDEAAKMLLYQQMFQGMSRYLNTVQGSLQTLMESM